MTPVAPETDSRFPSGRWIGFFLDKRMPGKHQMELTLDFAAGRMNGAGRDRVGQFVVTGSYDLADGKCEFVKQYLKAHAIVYKGYNEGKGIWGGWELVWHGSTMTGGFHIWPEGMADPSQPVIAEAVDLPRDIEVEVPDRELLPIGT